MKSKNPLFVLIYVPNLIGYLRIILLGFGFYHLFNDYHLGIAMYSISCALDALDGYAARLLNQSSQFGSLLDMLTDRLSTTCLLMTLGHIYHKYFLLFMFLLCLDIVSHWLHFHSAGLKGKSSHKTSDVNTNYFIRIYYGSKFVLTLVCFMEQLCYLSFVALFFETGSTKGNILLVLLYLSAPVTLFKNIVNLFQIIEACKVILPMNSSRLFVLIYVPNLIGYLRIILLGFGFYHLLNDYRLGIALYSISCALDALDGYAARLLNQSSQFGSLLDMLTDRLSTTCLLMTLGHFHNKYFLMFMFLLCLDIVSHWLHFHSSGLKGKSSHKTSDINTNWFIRIYYGSKFVLTLVCFMEQLCYLSLVALFFETGDVKSYFLVSLYLSAPITLFKNIVNLLQITEACKVILPMDINRVHRA